MEIEVKQIKIKLPKWKWWQWLLFLTGSVLIIKGDYQTLFSWIKLIIQ